MNVINTNKPKLKFSEFSNAWKIENLDNLTSKISDGIHSTPSYNNHGAYYFINGNNIKNGRILISNKTKKVDKEEAMKYKRALNENTLLISINGTIGNLGRYNNEKVMLGKSIAYLNFINYPTSKFIEYSFQTTKILNWFKSELTGSTIKNLSLKTLKNTKVYLPSLPEQQKIADFLTSVDKKIQALEKKKELLEKYKKGVMQKIFSQEIRFKKDDGRDYPEWEEKRLNQLMKVSKVKNLELKYSKKDVLSVSGKHGIVNQIEFQGRSFAGASVHNYGLVETGDIVYTKSPLKSNPYGIIKVNKGPTGIVSTLYAVYKVIDSQAVGEYLDYYFELDDNTNRYLRPLVRKGAKNDMKINNEYVLNDSISIPEVEEQIRIVSFLDELDHKILILDKSLVSLKKWKMGLLQQMFV